jgi:hypothetical protein
LWWATTKAEYPLAAATGAEEVAAEVVTGMLVETGATGIDEEVVITTGIDVEVVTGAGVVEVVTATGVVEVVEATSGTYVEVELETGASLVLCLWNHQFLAGGLLVVVAAASGASSKTVV